MPNLVLAQGNQFYSLSGIILDSETNEILPGANILLNNKAAVSDQLGKFQIKNLKEGSYKLSVSYVGYAKLTIDQKIAGDSDLIISLKKSSILTEEVIVTATRASEKTPTTFSEISKEDIKKQNLGQDMPFLLNFTPSLVVTSDAGSGVGYTGIRIRGSDPTRLNVTVNGIPLNDSESHGVWWVNMPDFASSVENIQIQRGVGTSTNGAAAFGASLNIQTTTLNQEAYAQFDNSAGSFNTQKHTVSAGTGLLNNRFAIDARLSKISSDGFVDRANSDLKSFFLSGGYYGNKTIMKWNVFSGAEKTYQSWWGVPEARLRNDVEGMQKHIANNNLTEEQANNLLNSGRTYNYYTYDNETDNYQQDHYQYIISHNITPNINLNAAVHYTKGRGYYEQYRRNDRLRNYGLPNITIGETTISRTNLIRRRWLDNDFYGYTFNFNYKSDDDKLEITTGGAQNWYDGDHFGEVIWAQYLPNDTPIRHRYYDNNAKKSDLNLFYKTLYHITGGFYGFLDLQVRSINYSFVGRSQINNVVVPVDQEVNYLFFNPKFGLTYSINPNNQFYGSYSRGNREPIRRDFTESSENSRPKHEKLHNLESGYRFQNSRIAFNANYYLMYYRDQLVLTGQINDVGGYTRTNIDKSFRTGIELELTGRLSNKLSVGANATLSRNKIMNYTEFIDNYDQGGQVATNFGMTDIAFSPNTIAGSILSYNPIKPIEVSLLSKYVGKQYLDNTSNESRKIDSYFTNDLRIIYTHRPKLAREINFTLLVNNLFNVMYESNGYTFSYLAGGDIVTENFYFPQAGTNLLAGISVRF
jgi:iron complex outermembrane recepter protein